MNTPHIKPKKLRAGRYQLGNLIVTKQEPANRGGATTWCDERGKVVGYSLGDVVRLANLVGSLVYDKVNGTKHHPQSARA